LKIMCLLRTAVVWLVVIAASGAAPVAVAGFEDAHGCGEMCARCWCKRLSADDVLRPRCPCCQPPGRASLITLLPSTVLPASTPLPSPPPARSVAAGLRDDAEVVAPSIPDPPPRTRSCSDPVS
jgi:hypothetical protein